MHEKAFLASLNRYCIKPCCDNVNHHVNYSSLSYLPALGSSVFRLRDNIRDALFMRRTSNFRVVCANKLMGIGPHLSNQAASDISRLWGVTLSTLSRRPTMLCQAQLRATSS